MTNVAQNVGTNISLALASKKLKTPKNNTSQGGEIFIQ